MSGRGLKAACLVAGLAMTLGVAVTVRADEGMWPYDHAPLAQIQKSYGFAPSQAWLDHLRLSSVNPGASAAFVSPDGLILTNHHVALSSVQRVSTPEHNYVRDGFFAATREQEIPLPGNTLKVLESIEEVTARVAAGVKPDMNPVEARAAREAAITAIEAECLQQTGLKGEVVALFGGAHHDLYRYKEYTDVRLVFVPELQAAFFGGDWDNFCYPRWDLDIAFLRAYENGRPARVENWLQVNPAGTRDGDVVFVSGNPGRTQRLKTLASLEYSRDYTYPERLARTRHQREVLRGYMARGDEEARRGRTVDYFYGNTLKRLEGELAGLREPRLMATKQADEKALRAAVAADAQLEARYGGAWERVAAAYAWAAAHDTDRLYRSEMPGGRFFSTALQLVRLQTEAGKPDADRLPGYHQTELPDLLRRLGSPSPVYKDMETVMAADAFQRLLNGLGAGDPFVQAVLQGRTPEAAAAFYLEGTRLDDVAVRRELAQDDGRAVPQSDDVLLVLARRLDPLLRGQEKAFRDNLRAVEESAETDIAQARFAVYGDKAYPDATGTLRFGFGRVAGYPSATTLVPPFTTWYGLYDRAFSFGDQGDFVLTPKERERVDRLDLAGILDMACTADITGGNSGSPIVDRDGRLVGVAFDGNQTSHANQFVYDETEARCVCVDVRGILQGLGRLYDAQPLVDELLAGAR
ncbi:MAG: S46 family peptidase [Candidatus Krumholzibacteriia bacterium]